MDEPCIRYASRPDATSQSELQALVACYSFLIERAEKRKAAEPGDGRQENREGGEGGREPGATAG